MYRNAYQRGMLTIFFSVGSKPLELWDVVAKDGYVTRFLDQDIKSMVVELRGTNVSTTYMTCPSKNRILGISMPYLVMIVKNLKKYFSFEVTILDETGARRRFRVSNFQTTTQILPMCTAMPIGLSEGWNQIQFNLSEFTRRAYQKQFVEVQKLKINANIRLRRIYFTERLIPDDELPPEYKLYFPLASKGAKGKTDKKAEQPAIPKAVETIMKKDSPTVIKLSPKSSVQSVVQKVPSKVRSLERAPVVEEAPKEEAPTEIAQEEQVGDTANAPAEAPTEASAEAAPEAAEEQTVTEEAAEIKPEEPPAEEPAAEEPPAEPAAAE